MLSYDSCKYAVVYFPTDITFDHVKLYSSFTPEIYDKLLSSPEKLCFMQTYVNAVATKCVIVQVGEHIQPLRSMCSYFADMKSAKNYKLEDILRESRIPRFRVDASRCRVPVLKVRSLRGELLHV